MALDGRSNIEDVELACGTLGSCEMMRKRRNGQLTLHIVSALSSDSALLKSRSTIVWSGVWILDRKRLEIETMTMERLR